MNSQGKILVGTTKGLLHVNTIKQDWEVSKVDFPGLPVSMIHYDHKAEKCWIGLSMKHWGAKLFRSFDNLRSWEDIAPPVYSDAHHFINGKPASLKLIWSAYFDARRDKLWIGTEPGGLFESETEQSALQINEALWDHPTRTEHWFGGGRDHAGIHTILGHPSDPDFLLVGVSCGGVFITQDGGISWTERNQGLRADYLPNPFGPHGHDPHAIKICDADPATIWQQNHCGVFISRDQGNIWQDVTPKDDYGRYGFALAIDDYDPAKAWIIPAESDDQRVAKDLRLVVCKTEDGGKSWRKLTNGLPQKNCFDLVFRHALSRKDGLMCFGTTTGNLFISRDDGESWIHVHGFLPPIHSVAII